MPSPLKSQLQEKEREIALLHAISEIVSASPTLDDLLKQFSELVAKQLKADSVLIYLFEGNQEELVLRGSNTPHPQQLGRIKLRLGEGITGWVAEKRKPAAISKHAADDPRFKPFTALQEDRFEAF